jgi:hypothetical protein
MKSNRISCTVCPHFPFANHLRRSTLHKSNVSESSRALLNLATYSWVDIIFPADGYLIDQGFNLVKESSLNGMNLLSICIEYAREISSESLLPFNFINLFRERGMLLHGLLYVHVRAFLVFFRGIRAFLVDCTSSTSFVN